MESNAQADLVVRRVLEVLPRPLQIMIGALAESNAALAPFCDPEVPADCRLAAQAHSALARRSRAHQQAACLVPYCLFLDVDGIDATGGLQDCLRWLSSVNIQQLRLGSGQARLSLQDAQALAHCLTQRAPAALAYLDTLLLEAHRPEQLFDAEIFQACTNLASLELRWFQGADLAALPPSVQRVALLLPTARHALLSTLQAAARIPQEQQPGVRQLSLRNIRALAEIAAAGGHAFLQLPAYSPAAPADLLAQLPQGAGVYLAEWTPTSLEPIMLLEGRLRESQSLLGLILKLGVGPSVAVRWALQLIEGASSANLTAVDVISTALLCGAYLALRAAGAAARTVAWRLGRLHAQEMAWRLEGFYLDGLVTQPSLGFLITSPGGPAVVPGRDAGATHLGRVLHQCLAQSAALGMLRPLVRPPPHRLEHLYINGEGLDLWLDASQLGRSVKKLKVSAQRLQLLAPPAARASRAGLQPAPDALQRHCLSSLLAALAASGVERAELAAAQYDIRLHASINDDGSGGSGGGNGSGGDSYRFAADQDAGQPAAAQLVATSMSSSQLFDLLPACLPPGVAAKPGRKPTGLVQDSPRPLVVTAVREQQQRSRLGLIKGLAVVAAMGTAAMLLGSRARRHKPPLRQVPGAKHKQECELPRLDAKA